MNRIVVTLLYTLIFTPPCYALEKPNQDIYRYVETLIDEAFAVLNNQSLSKEKKIIKSQNLMEQNLDVIWMAEFTLGRHKRNLNEAEIASFKEIYKKYVVKSYSQKIRYYKGEKIEIKKVMPIGSNEFAVQTTINSQTNKNNNINVDFMIRKKTSGASNRFYVFDIVTEGVSLLTAQRSEFGSVISSRGIDYLIQILQNKINEKS